MHGSKVLFDTSVLIEILEGSEKGNIAKEIFTSNNTSPQVAAISIAELSSKLKRASHDPSHAIQKISESAEILPLGAQVAANAGILHATLRKKAKNISLADCIIMAHADEHGALVVTTDRHFALYKNSRIL